MTSTRSVEPRIYEVFTTMKDWPNAGFAAEFLHDIANAVAPILQRHHWHIESLEEFYPDNTGVLSELKCP